MKFKSKKDDLGKMLLLVPTMIITLLTLVIATGVVDLASKIPLTPFVFATLFFWTFLVVAWNFTYYELKENKLIARFAFFKYRKIKLENITGFKKTKFGPWIYGLSKDVLIVEVKNGQNLNISPSKPDTLIKEIEKRRSIPKQEE